MVENNDINLKEEDKARREEYDDASKPEENRISIVELFREVKQLNSDIHKFEKVLTEKVSKIREILKNGIDEQTTENKKMITKMYKTINSIDKKISVEEAKKEGKNLTWQKIKIYGGIFIAGVATTLTILQILGALKII